MVLKPEKRVVHVKVIENENRNIRAVTIRYTDGSKETVTSDRITKESR